MAVITAITTCLAKYAVFEGRASRSEFWWFNLATTLAAWLAVPVFSGTLDAANSEAEVLFAASWTQVIICAALFVPTLAVSARRLHDTNRSGWWYLLSFTLIGLIPLLIWWCQKGDGYPNSYSSPSITPASRDIIATGNLLNNNATGVQSENDLNFSDGINRERLQKNFTRKGFGAAATLVFAVTSIILFAILVFIFQNLQFFNIEN